MAERTLPRIPGQFYTPHYSTTPVASTEARLMLWPFDLGAPMKIDQTILETTVAGGVGEVVRMGYYHDDGSLNRPGLLLADLGTQPVDGAIGLKTYAQAVTLPAGRVWVAGAAQGASGTTPTIRSALQYARITTPTLAGTFQNTVCVDGITGALPASLVGATFLTLNFGIAIGVRLA